MKTISAAFAALALTATVATAAPAKDVKDFFSELTNLSGNIETIFEDQDFFGENFDADAVQSGRVLVPQGIFTTDR